MASRNKILISLLLISLVLVLYLIFTSESAKEMVGRQIQPLANKHILSAAEYQAKVKEIFSTYEQLTKTNNLTEEKIAALENQLLSLRLDSSAKDKFQTLHLSLAQSMDRMKDYLATKTEREKNSSQQLIDRLKADFGWLNN